MNLKTLLLPCVLLSACFTPEDSFNDFVARKRKDAPDGGASPDGGGNTTSLRAEQLTGSFLYAVSPAFFPLQPTVYLAELTASQVGDQLAVTLRQRPLASADRRTPVGEWSEPRTDQIDASGRYETEEVVSVIPAAANPITGVESTTEVAFAGVFVNPATPDEPNATVDFFCGTVSGRVINPALSLDGSTFAAIRLPDPEDLDSYPDVVINCDKEPASPLP